MNKANGERTRDLENDPAYHSQPSSLSEKPSREVDQRSAKMAKLQHCIFSLILLCILAVGVTSANLNYNTPPAPGRPQALQRFQELLKSLDRSMLPKALHEDAGDKHRHGVFREDKTAVDAIRQADSEVAESLIELAKRQATGSGNATISTSTVVVVTGTVLTTTESATNQPSSDPATTPIESQSSTTASESQEPTSEPTSTPSSSAPATQVPSTVSETSTAPPETNSVPSSSLESTPASNSATPTSPGMYPNKRLLAFTFTPPSLPMNYSSLASPYAFIPAPVPSTMNFSSSVFPYGFIPTNITTNTTSVMASQYVMPTSSVSPDLTIIVPKTAFTAAPVLCFRNDYAACLASTISSKANTTRFNESSNADPTSSVQLKMSSSVLLSTLKQNNTMSVAPAKTTCSSSATFTYASAASSVVTNTTSADVVVLTLSVPANTSCSSLASTPYAVAPTGLSPNSSSSAPYVALPNSNTTNSLPPYSFPDHSNTTLPLSCSTPISISSVPFGYPLNNSTSGPSSTNTSSSPSSSSNSGSSTNTSSPPSSSFSSSGVASISPPLNPETSSDVSPSRSRTTIYTTTLANGAATTVTSVTVLSAGQADQTTSESPASTTSKAGSLQTAGASKIRGVGGTAAFGLVGIIAMVAF